MLFPCDEKGNPMTVDVETASTDDASTDIRIFASASHEPRGRRIADALALALSLLVLGWAAWQSEGKTLLEMELIDFLRAWPSWMVDAFGMMFVLVAIYAIGLLIGITFFARQRLDVARDMLTAAAIAILASELLGRVVADGWPDVWFQAMLDDDGPPVFPVVRMAAVTAVVSAASPHMSQPMRKIGRWVVGITLLSSLVLPIGLPLDVLGGAAIGFASAAVVKLIFGSPAGRPTRSRVADALAELGVEAHDLKWTEQQPRGAATLTARGVDDQALAVKVYGRDARDTQLLDKLWRFAAYRDAGATLTLSRERQVEHEALMTLLASTAGATVPQVLAAGTTAAGDALLITTDYGPTLTDDGARELDNNDLAALWADLDRCHGARIAHDALEPSNIAVGKPVGLVGWGSATLSAESDRRNADRAGLLATTALVVGDERAIAVARTAIGDDSIAESLSYLQPAALRPELRRLLHNSGKHRVDELADAAAAAIGIDRPDVEKLRRVTWGKVVMVLIGSLAAWALVSMFSEIGLQSLIDTISGAKWGWIALALVLAQVARLGNAVALVGSTDQNVRLVPALHLQFATTFINLAIPSSAARMASNIRFGQKSGMSSTQAVTVGAVNSVSGFIVQITLLVLVILAGAGSDQLGLSDDLDGSVLRLVVIVGIILLVSLGILLLIPRVRQRLASIGRQARDAGQVLRSPRRLAMLFGGGLFAELTFSLAILCCVNAYGATISFASVIFVNEVVALFAGLMPVPGGIGITEAALTAGLVAFGVPEDQAFAAAISYRMVSFYLPPLWGYLSLKWLRKHDYM